MTRPLEDNLSSHRLPQRSHGRKRFEILLDAVEDLLSERESEDASLAEIAEKAEIPLSSVYHFFPNRNAAYIALAERFHAGLRALSSEPMNPAPQTWQEIISTKQQAGIRYLNRHPAALRLFMGAGISVDVRNLDLVSNTQLASSRAEYLCRYFHTSHLPNLADHLAVAISLTDGIWSLSYSIARSITPHYADEAFRASILYLRSYLPEYLVPRQTDQSGHTAS